MLAALYLRAGNLTFGGGDVITATLQREMVHARGWLTLDQYGLAQSLAKITPGTGILAFCAATAWMLRRWAGAAVAVLAASVPCAVFAVVLTWVYTSVSTNRTGRIALAAVLSSAVGMMWAAAWLIVRPQLTSRTWLRTTVLFLYSLILKATLTTFSGTATLPVVREDFVVRHRLLTDRELNLAFTAGRSGPGPNGVYLVSVGYMVAGVPGACVGWLAMITPAFLVIPLVRIVGARVDNPRLLGAIRASTAANAGLLLAANVPMARDALTDGFLAAIAVASFAVFSFTRIDSVWVILSAAAVGLAGAAFIH